MKAVIVECSNGAAVALCDDGSFKKLRNRGYFIGQELLLKEKASANHVVQKLSICASLALVLLAFAGIGSYSYVKPYSYVSLDINPSIEYALNRYDKVISVSGINDKGQQVVSSIETDVKNQNITTALGVTIRQLEKENYIVQEEYNHVIVSVCSDNDSKARSIASHVNTFSMEETHVCSIDAMAVSKEVKNDADSLGITPGKLALIQAVAVAFADADFDVSEWTDKTVNELEITIQQASSQTPGSITEETLINSEYLSSVLDDSTAQKADSSATVSAVEAGTLTGSTSTVQQTSTTNNTTTGSSTNASVSDSKPDHTGSASSPAADSSPAKTDQAGSTDKSGSADTGTADNSSPAAEQGDSSKPSDKDQAGSDSKETSDSDADKNQTENDFKEDSTSKKDSYTQPDADTMEDVPNEADGQTSVDHDSIADSETPNIVDVSDSSNDSQGTEDVLSESTDESTQSLETPQDAEQTMLYE